MTVSRVSMHMGEDVINDIEEGVHNSEESIDDGEEGVYDGKEDDQ